MAHKLEPTHCDQIQQIMGCLALKRDVDTASAVHGPKSDCTCLVKGMVFQGKGLVH